ncbi:MAG: phosphoribosylglycinamide formyltransferase, partial [Sphingobacteriia bacterium]|nr:phosphoribosylglycinamide formyltransferase [Sphingobacteriia bacterium]
MNRKKNIAIFASGNGTNFEALTEACQNGKINATIQLLICDNSQAFV